MNTTVPTSVYAQRRARMAAQLGANGIALIPTAPERQRNRDADFLFRHDSYFYYLTGFTEPNAWLVVTGDGKSTLFCQPKDLEREIWDGFRLGPEAAVGALAAFTLAPAGSPPPPNPNQANPARHGTRRPTSTSPLFRG